MTPFQRSWFVIVGLTLIQVASQAAPERVTDVGVANRSNAYASIATSGRSIDCREGPSRTQLQYVAREGSRVGRPRFPLVP
jgi:hypothetical protein